MSNQANNNKKNILITGGAGYIGTQIIANALRLDRYNIFVIDNLSTGHKTSLLDKCSFTHADVRDADKLDLIFRNNIDAVIHLAAKLNVSESVEKPHEYYDNNINATLALINACNKYKVNKVVFSSTAAVYCGSNYESLVNENSTVNPITPYGWSKYFCEQIFKDAGSAHKINTIILRYFNVAGADSKLQTGLLNKKATHLIGNICNLALNNQYEIPVYGNDYPTKDGTGVRDYIHVEDLALIHLLALDALFSGHATDIYNCGYGQGHSVLDVINTFSKSNNLKLTPKFLPRRIGDAAQVVADSSKLQKQLGWIPQFNNLETITRSAFEWAKTL